MSPFLRTTLAGAAILGLAACQTTTDTERAVLGAAIGCAAGEIIDDGKCITGGALGALAGVLADDAGVVN